MFKMHKYCQSQIVHKCSCLCGNTQQPMAIIWKLSIHEAGSSHRIAHMQAPINGVQRLFMSIRGCQNVSGFLGTFRHVLIAHTQGAAKSTVFSQFEVFHLLLIHI